MYIVEVANLLLSDMAGIGQHSFQLSKRLKKISSSTFSFYTPVAVQIKVTKSIKADFFSRPCAVIFFMKFWSRKGCLYWAKRDSIIIMIAKISAQIDCDLGVMGSYEAFS